MLFKVYATGGTGEKQGRKLAQQAGYGTVTQNPYVPGGYGGNATQGRRVTRGMNRAMRDEGFQNLLKSMRNKNPRTW